MLTPFLDISLMCSHSFSLKTLGTIIGSLYFGKNRKIMNIIDTNITNIEPGFI